MIKIAHNKSERGRGYTCEYLLAKTLNHPNRAVCSARNLSAKRPSGTITSS